MSTESIYESGFHSHCLKCIKARNCNVSIIDGISCEIITCHNKCGFLFHLCKKEEHLLLCPEEKVLCYNACNGCPFQMKRKFLSAHLEHCPASVVHCTMEWHRSLKTVEVITPRGIHLHCESCVAGSCSLELNGYNCVVISCPLSCGMTMHSCKYTDHRLLCPNEKIFCPNASNGCQYTTHRKYMKKHYFACYQKCMEQKILPSRNKEHNIFQFKGLPLKSLDIAFAIRDLSTLKWQIENQLLMETNNPYYWDYTKRIIGAKSISHNCFPSTTESKKAILTQLINKLTMVTLQNVEELSPEQNLLLDQIKVLVDENKKLKVENEMLKAKCEKKDINQNESNFKDTAFSILPNKASSNCDNWEKLLPDEVDQNNTESDSHNFTADAFNSLLTYPTRFLGLHPEHRSPAGFQEFSFFCSQEFRRDQYHMHYKNVHDDIQGGLNSGLQERCPLATYGCTFVKQVLKPYPLGSKIVYNEMVESFGVQPLHFPQHEGDLDYQCDRINLCDLPYEILRHIAGLLDCFSLRNLSHTCELFQTICQSLLTERGLVSLKWEQQETNGVFKWVNTGVKWNFSTHFSPIHNWKFDPSADMARHLKHCKYNNVNIIIPPYRNDGKIDKNQYSRIVAAKNTKQEMSASN